MKILHIIPTYLPAYRYGGPIESVHGLNKALVSAGAEVTVYTTDIDGSESLNVPKGIPVMIDGVKVFYFKHSFPRSWFYSLDMSRALAKHAAEFDVIHITSVFLAVSWLGARFARKFRKPYVISPRGSLMREPLGKKSLKKKIYLALIEKMNLKNAAAIHFTVPAEEGEYREAGLLPRRAITIPNSVDLRSLGEAGGEVFRKKFGIGPEKKIVLSLGRLNWKKGFDTLVPAFAEVAKAVPSAILVIAGGDDEQYKKVITQMIEENGLRERVIFAGPISRDQKSSAYAASDVFVLPSYSENFGMVVAEAMGFGLPVVVTNGVGISNFVTEASAGLVVRKDPAELASALLWMFHNPEEAKEMGKRGEGLVRDRFSPSEIASAFMKEYISLNKEYS